MIVKSSEANAGIDRLATADEIRIALSPLDDCDVKETTETLLEIPSDRGGYIRLSTEEFEFLSLMGEVNRLMK